MLYMVTWIRSIYPIYVSIYTSTMDPVGMNIQGFRHLTVADLTLKTPRKTQRNLAMSWLQLLATKVGFY